MMLLFFFILLSCSLGFSNLLRGIIVTTPREWLAGSEEKICLVHHGLESMTLDVIIQLTKLGDETVIYAEKTFLWSSEKLRTESIFLPPNVTENRVKIHIRAASQDPNVSYSFNQNTVLTIKRSSHLTFVQTDKPIYKPSDTVRVRILTVQSPDLKVVNDIMKLAFIEDPSNTRIVQWRNVTSQNGLFSLEIRLSDQPRLGKWTFRASINDIMHIQTFIVKEYVLPKFQVSIIHPSYVLPDQNEVKWKICAQYTYGKPVIGDVYTTACIQDTYARRPINCFYNKKHQLTDGCMSISSALHNASYLQQDIYHSWSYELKIEATLEEKGTGVKLNASHSAKFVFTPMKINLNSFNQPNFKPGLVYYGRGQVVRPDDSPVKNENIKLKITGVKNNMEINSHNYTVIVPTDDNGMFKFNISKEFTIFQMDSLKIMATVENFVTKSLHTRAPQTELYLKPWYSPSKSFLQIIPSEHQPIKCDSQMNISVAYISTHNLSQESTFYYQLMSRGNIVKSGLINPFNSTESSLLIHEFSMILEITPSLSGSARLLIFYLHHDGELVADSLQFDVEPCFENMVSMEFNHLRHQPGHPLMLHLKADSQSLCSVSVVDKSVDLMGESKHPTKSTVFQLLKEYDLSRPSEYRSGIEQTTCGSVVEQIGNRRYNFMRQGPIQSNYVDSKEAFLATGMVSLTDLKLVTRPCEEQRIMPYYLSAHSSSGDRASRPMMGMGAPGPGTQEQIRHEPIPMAASNHIPTRSENQPTPVVQRTYFPETWLWMLQSIGDSGEENVGVTLPHTVTEWIGNGFCTNTRSGLGVASQFSVTGFQPFFLSFTLPYSMIRGETAGIPISIFNYLSSCLKVTVVIEESRAFELINSSVITEIKVCGQKTETHKTYIIPRQLGRINFTVKASSSAYNSLESNSINSQEEMTAEDILTQPLLIEAEGKEEELTKSAFLCSPANGEWTINLPEDDIVSDSKKTSVSVIGDVMGPSLSGLDSLLKLPTGCGEQNMVKFAPNIFIMEYLKRTNSLTGDISLKAMEFLQTGYQRELTYRHDDGSYSAFGKSDPQGSIWLTAFVVKSFAGARPFIFIDKNDLHKSILWIESLQLENGCFPQHGRLLDKSLKGGLGNGEESLVPLTAYITAALLEAGLDRNHSVIVNAMQCLQMEVNTAEDVHTLSLMSYVYSLWNRSSTQFNLVITKLNAKAINSDGMMHWEGSAGAHGSVANIETTAYVLLALLNDAGLEVIEETIPIVRWLTTQRNSYGGFSSTQDTVLALQALATFAGFVYHDEVNVRILFSGLELNQTFDVTQENRLVLQKQEGLNLPARLLYSVTGNGCVLAQASVKYNTLVAQNDQQAAAFFLTVQVQNGSSSKCRDNKIHVCARYNGRDDASNMAVIAVKMISGWIPIKDSVEKLKNSAQLGLKRFEIEKNSIQFYFDELDKHDRCFTFGIFQELEIINAKPATVHVYDYYEPSLSTYSEYIIETRCSKKDKKHTTAGRHQQQLVSGANSSGMIADMTAPETHLNYNESRIKEKTIINNCPTCHLNGAEEIQKKICNATYVYQILIRRKNVGRLLSVIQAPEGIQLNSTGIRIQIPHHCNCSVLREGSNATVISLSGFKMARTSLLLRLQKSDYIICPLESEVEQSRALSDVLDPNKRMLICQNYRRR